MRLAEHSEWMLKEMVPDGGLSSAPPSVPTLTWREMKQDMGPISVKSPTWKQKEWPLLLLLCKPSLLSVSSFSDS